MPRTARVPEFLALRRHQLDDMLGHDARLRDTKTPVGGWVRAIRSALGMSAAQLGKRLGASQQHVADLERREARGGVTLHALSAVADAMGCDLVVAMVPRTSLEDTMHRQAEAKAREEQRRVVHTMRLEAQEAGAQDALDLDAAAAAWMTTRLAHLWD